MMHNSSLHEDAIAGKAYDARLIRRFLQYVAPYRLQVTLILLILPLEALCRLAQPLLVKYAIDQAIIPGKLEMLFQPTLAFIALLLLEAVLSWFEIYGLQSVGQRVMADLRNELFARVLRFPTSWFDKTPTGATVTRLTSDVEALGEMFAAGIITIVGDLLLLAGIITAMLLMDLRLSLVTFVVLPPLVIAAILFRRWMRQAFREVRAKLGQMNSHLAEAIGGIAIIQAFGREQDEARRFTALNSAHKDANMPVITWDASLYAIVEALSSVAIALIIWYGGGEILQGKLTFGTLVAFIHYTEKFFGPIRDLSAKYGVMQGAMAAMERLFALLDEDIEGQKPGIPATAQAEDPKQRLTHPLIQFRQVSFAYRTDEPTLSNFNLTLNKGERVALVGESGGGKTTVVRLLGRHYETDEGEILLNGIDIRQMDLRELRSKMAVVLQDPAIFAGTIAFNISLGDQAAEKRVAEAAATVGADRFIEKLPLGFQTMVSERGSNLSVGERQLISFARAVAFNPELLVLDEATASVDSASEELIQEGLHRLLTGRTALVIAHRLSTVRDADRIVVISAGQVVEQGNHDQLMAMNGEYARLYCLQFDCGKS
jgi:ATP-binding cassette subfamily B protein